MADREVLAHREWLGYVQPIGVLVTPPALVACQAHVNANIAPMQRRFLEVVSEHPDVGVVIDDLPKTLEYAFGWSGGDLEEPSQELECSLPEYGETLRPTYAVAESDPVEGTSKWQLLVAELPVGTSLDEAAADHARGWEASPQAKFERLLREVRVPAGLLSNGTAIRLIYAPSGETSGYITFPVDAMTQVAGRPIFAALHMLIGADRLFALPRGQRLPALLTESRRYQNEVSTKLAEQVLAALYELLRGFQAADDATEARLLGEVLRDDPDEVYAGLLTCLLRLVFLLYAEDRSLMPVHETYVRHYAVGGLFERLRDDAGRNPDTMDHRYGAWAHLLSLFRIVHDGASHGALRLPPRHGYLFDPDRYPFLEGRPHGTRRVLGDVIEAPLVSDGVVWRVLRNLLVLDGERLSYRSLDVEQIGSVYETLMGFRLETATGRSIAIKPVKRHGAPITIDVDAMLAESGSKRAKWVQDRADRKPTPKESNALSEAKTINDVVAALEGKIDRRATPSLVPAGAMVFQPSEERRRTGSHYTPRELTEPIVRTTLRPILERLGERPTPEQILDLKVCDPAMGSGAFLVEACRQLGDALVDAWHAQDAIPTIPPDSDEVLHARRMIAQRCLYGVDRNPIAVDLSKLSLWLATLASGHAFTFLDHALRHGDSLVGLKSRQIGGFTWETGGQQHFLLGEKVTQAAKLRAEIREAPDGTAIETLRLTLREADDAVETVRAVGDLAIGAYFSRDKARGREERRQELAAMAEQWLTTGAADRLRTELEQLREERWITPFHWEIEFPEVFSRERPGFDVIVGNPPFAGKNTLAAANPDHYPDWLKTLHEESHGNADIVAHFFRRAFGLLREGGAFGLIATNTIGQGDTRTTGLRWICTNGGTIFGARKRVKWPGESAAVVVSVVHICHGDVAGPFDLDGRRVDRITAYLLHAGGHENPERLSSNAGLAFQGSIVLGMGFTFDDTDKKGVASSLAEMKRVIDKNPRNAERIFPYIGGEEINSSPVHAHHRYVINFGDLPEDEARTWPELMAIVEERVRPERKKLPPKNDWNRSVARRWWQFGADRVELRRAVGRLDHVLATTLHAPHLSIARIPADVVFSHALGVFAFDSYGAFALLQSRVHEVWARFASSSIKDDLRYSLSDCFETFPFPAVDLGSLESAGEAYFTHRAQLMVESDEGLTKTYNRFHDPEEQLGGIIRLRQLHDEMDHAVLQAYGWTDIALTCDFFLEYSIDDDDSRRKKPWRYRWPEEIHDEVLARLVALNGERARAERLAGRSAGGSGSRRRKASTGTRLFEDDAS